MGNHFALFTQESSDVLGCSVQTGTSTVLAVDTFNTPTPRFNELDESGIQVCACINHACPLIAFVCITEFSKMILYSQVLALWTGGSLARKHVTYSTWTVCVMANCHVCRFSRRIVGQDTEPSDFDLDSDYFFFFGFGNSARGEYLAVVHTAQSSLHVDTTSLIHTLHIYTGSSDPENFPQHENTPAISVAQYNPVQAIGEITPLGLVSAVTAPVCEQQRSQHVI